MGYQDEDELSEEGFLEMLADYDKLGKLKEQYRELPHSPQRMELCREAVAVADRLEEPTEQMIGLCLHIWRRSGQGPAGVRGVYAAPSGKSRRAGRG